MRTLIVMLSALVLVSCSDVLPQKQCDPARRCAPTDTPVCGVDGTWYECGLVAQCEEVAVTQNQQTCGATNNTVCPDIACDDCENLVETRDDNGCLIACECGPTDCPTIDLDCADIRTGSDGCPVCADGCNTPTCEADGCSLVAPAAGGCPTCVCEPIQPVCQPIDVDACSADPNCSLTRDNNGCQQCICGPVDECPRDFCTNFCPNGYLIKDGCATCECFDPCSLLPECDLFCPTGNTTDPATQCSKSCECNADSCEPVGCRIFCENGYRRDSSGCDVCECRGTTCTANEGCALDEACVMDSSPLDVTAGECVKLDLCDGQSTCPDGGPCGFYFRQDCCPPLTTCTDDMAACPAVCLLTVGDLPVGP